MSQAVSAEMTPEASPSAVSRTELALVRASLAAAFVLRFIYMLRYRVDSDEPQHLHVAWGWAHGLVQYRDLFDNHTPLFHMLYSLPVAVLGDRADLLILLRMTMLPICALAFLCAYLIGRWVFSRRVGLWAAALTALVPPVFACSTEFRSDVLWMAMWLVFVAVLVRPPLTKLRAFTAGFFLGVSVSVSLKTVYLLGGAIGAALATMLVLARLHPWRTVLGRFVAPGLAMLPGLAIVPAALILFFGTKDALGGFYYGAIGHNIVPGLNPLHWHRPLLACIGVGVSLLCVVSFVGVEAPAVLKVRRTFVLFLGSMMLLAISFWPVTANYSFLPIHPLLAVMLAVGLDRTLPWLASRLKFRSFGSVLYPVAAVGCGMLVVGITATIPGENRTAPDVQRWRQLLRMTDLSQTVMDQKGELIFRRRAYYYGLEKLTRRRFELGLLKDDIAERLVATRTCVVSPEVRGIPPRSLAFVRENYLPVGSLLVAGKYLESVGAEGVITFDVRLPVEYVIVTPLGRAGGTLDGSRVDGSRLLDAGPHEYRPRPGEAKLALVWAQAVQRGFSPFAPVAPGPETSHPREP